ncbi:rhomboid family intramembrane serine protease [Humidesulfovibrio sp.]
MRPLRHFARPRRPRRERAADTGTGAVGGVSATAAASPTGGDDASSRAAWPDLAPLVDGTPAGRLPQKEAKLWSLVLRARRVPHRVRSLPGGYTVQVPGRFARQAVEEISLYHKENVSPHPSIPLPDPQERARATVAGMLCLCAFFVLTQRPWPLLGSYPQYWHTVGVADAGALLSGQLWRAATALTLHADPAHVASNAVIGGAFLILLARRAGSGTAWLLAVLAGVLGNLLNAAVHALLGGPTHLSVGFSTAVFGAAGVLAGLKAASGEGDFRAGMRAVKAGLAGPAGQQAVHPANQAASRQAKGWLLPVAAGLALVASLGTAGDDTDIGAHFFGLLAGLGLGGLAGWLALDHGRPDEWAGGRLNPACGAASVLILASAWAWGWLCGWPAPLR